MLTANKHARKTKRCASILCKNVLTVKEQEWLKNIDKKDNVNNDSIQTTSILSLQNVKEWLLKPQYQRTVPTCQSDNGTVV